MPLPDIVSNLSTAQFRQYVLETLESIAGTTGQVAGLSNLSTAKFRQYMLGLLVEIAQNGGGGGGAPSGPAGGDLSATYPNPTVSKLLGRTLAIATPTNGQVLAWNAASSSWTPTSVTGTGTVTSITAGAGLSGGTITGSGTIALTTTGVAALPYGSATQVPAFVVDIYGRITSVTNQAITPAGIGAQPALTTATPLALSLGGTGSTTAASALSNLGGITSASLAGLATTTQLSAYQTALTSASPAGITQGGTGATTAVAALLNLGGITSAALAGLASTSQLSAFQNSAQVQALASAQIAAITPASIGALSTSQASSFATTQQIIGIATTAQLSAFQNSAQVQALASAQISAITPASIGALSTDAASGFATTGQISGFTNTAQVSAIASAQIAAITPASIGALSTSAAAGFATTEQIVGIAVTSQLSGFATTDQISGFTNTAQVSAIASAQIAAITPASLGAVATSDIIGITKGGTGSTSAAAALSALGGITSASLSGFATTAQVSSLTSAQVEALTSAQIAALGTGLGAGQKYVASKTYMVGDVVSAEGTSGVYVSLVDNNVSFPLYDPNYWKLVDANAIRLQGYGISNSTPQNGQVLKFQSGYDIWVPGDVSITSAQLPSNTLEAIGGAPLAEPYFTGYGPQGPTKSFGTNNNYLATTAFVRQNSSLFKFSPVGQSQEISVGTKYIFATDLSFIPKQAVLLYADSSNYMTGSIVSYNGGLLEINVTNAVGSGVYDITITVSPEVTGGGGGGGLDSAQVNALVTEQIAALGTGLGAGQVWNSSKTYSAGDVVTANGSSLTYVSFQNNNTGNPPNAGFPWALISTNAAQLNGNNIAMGNPSLGDVLTYNGAAWAPTAPASGLNSAQVEALTSTQIAAITPASIGAVATSDIIAISKGGTGSTDAASALVALGAAALDSPAFTGTPTAPTAAAHTNTTQVATTAFVMSNSGDRYLTTSTTLNSVSGGTKTFTVEAGLSYTPTQDCTIVFDASNHMHAVVSSYSGTTLVVDVTQHTGSGSYSVWTINVGGLTTAAGSLLSANNLSDVANAATSLTNLGGVSTARTISAGTGLSGGGDLTANRTLSLADTSVAAGSYGSSTQIAALTVDAQGRLTAVANVAIPPSPNIQVFNTPGAATWTKPENAKQVIVELVSGGGGGGAGGKAASGTAVYGGGGGGAGGYSMTIIDASELTDSTYIVTVGAGGAGAVFGVSNSGVGLASSFAPSSSPTAFLARAQSGGSSGGNGSTTGAVTGSGGAPNSNAGGAANITGTGGTGAGSANAPTGGGAGGGCSAANAAFNGGNGATNPFINVVSLGGGGSSVANGNNANPATTRPSVSLVMNGGGGGGGGASSFASGSGGNGANGSGYGTGGGGGGATQGSGNGGNGGNGASGVVVVTTYF